MCVALGHCYRHVCSLVSYRIAMWFKLLVIFQLQLLLQLANLFFSYSYSYNYQYVTVTVTGIAELSTLPIILT